jgi:ABC-type spermidine/putrescine transport system permease subunit II
MGWAEHGRIGLVLRFLAALGFAYLLVPILMMFPLSVEPGSVLRFPPSGISFHWYVAYLSNPLWLASTVLSFKVAAGATTVSTTVGTLAALGLARSPAWLRNFCQLLLMSPVFLPTIVVAIAIYGMFASLRLVGTPSGLIVARAVLTIPFVILNVATAIAAVPRDFEEAAMSLGSGPVWTFFRVTLPLIWRGIAAGGVFAFLVSFDEVVIAMFLSGTQAVTLPKRMLDGIFYEMTPILSAISVLLVLMNIALVALGMFLTLGRETPSPSSE